MGWRQRFDPSRVRVDKLRERAKRLANVRTLGDQVAQVRRVGMRGEILVPIIAVLILAVTLGLSAIAPSNDPGSVLTPGGSASAVAEASSAADASASASAGSYPAPPTATLTGAYPSPESSDTTGITETATLTATESVIVEGVPTPAGYPDAGSGPEGVGQPPSGGVPTQPDQSGYPNPTVNPGTGITIPTPQLIPPTTPPRLPIATPRPYVPPASTPRGSVPQPTSSSGYPAPTQTTAGGGTNPQPGAPTPQGATPDIPPPEAGTPVATDPSGATPEAGNPTPQATPTPGTPTATPAPPTPTARPAQVLSGDVRWTAANSPIVVTENQLVAQGASLTIDPGVEVRFAPDIRLEVAGTLRANGSAGAPIRMVGSDGRWDGVVGGAGSSITLEGVALRQAGRNGTAISSTGGALAVRNSTIADSGGGIVAIGSAVDIRGTQITGNAIAGPAINVQLPRQDGTAIVGNIVGGNGATPGAPQILIAGGDAPGSFALENNQIIGAAGPGAVLTSDVPLSGTVRCNSFQGGPIGLQITTKRRDTGGFNLAIDTNAFAGQSRFGATGSLAFNLLNNWWGDASGPQDAQRNPSGRGVPIGVSLQFQPWLSERPACAPQ